MNKRQQILSRALALSIFLTLVEHVGMLRVAVGPLLGIQSTPAALIVVWSWLLLAGGALAGLTQGRRWGAYTLAALVPISTFLMGIPLIPGLTALTPSALQFAVLVTLNVIVLAAVPVLVQEPAPATSPANMSV